MSPYNPSPDSLPPKEVRRHLEPATFLVPRVEMGFPQGRVNSRDGVPGGKGYELQGIEP